MAMLFILENLGHDLGHKESLMGVRCFVVVPFLVLLWRIDFLFYFSISRSLFFWGINQVIWDGSGSVWWGPGGNWTQSIMLTNYVVGHQQSLGPFGACFLSKQWEIRHEGECHMHWKRVGNKTKGIWEEIEGVLCVLLSISFNITNACANI